LLRVGVTYQKTLGMRRLTNTPVDLAIGKDGDLHILSRSDELTFIRRLSIDDDDLGAVNLVGGGGQVGGTSQTDGHFVWPASIIMDSAENLWVSDEATCKISNITTEGKVICQWGEQGGADGQLNRPSGIAFDSNGDIYVADTLNHRIQKFTTDGKFLMNWGSHGTGKGDFDMPWGIAVDELDDVYVADWRNDRIQKFSADGKFVMQVGKSGSNDGEFNRPSGVEIDKDGDIYVADWGNHRIQLFGPDGHFVEKFIGDATLSRQAKNYMESNLMALRLREMTSIELQKRLRWPVSVRTDADGRIYMADYGSMRIQIYQKEAYPLGPDEISDAPRSNSLFTQF
jgi:DNA-binding beta-propeller fold protein YncE